nr:MAG TPA: hypothetical protein [Caudoviricetes sp.]
MSLSRDSHTGHELLIRLLYNRYKRQHVHKKRILLIPCPYEKDFSSAL